MFAGVRSGPAACSMLNTCRYSYIVPVVPGGIGPPITFSCSFPASLASPRIKLVDASCEIPNMWPLTSSWLYWRGEVEVAGGGVAASIQPRGGERLAAGRGGG